MRPFLDSICCGVLVAVALNVSVIPQANAAAWITNSPLFTARYSHTATLLSNGKVLVAGGWNSNYLSSAELFDPSTGKWEATSAMTTNRCYHTATMLSNGKVLVVGGYANDPPHELASAELYDPVTGTWTNTGALNRPRSYHAATLLTNGNVLVAGGDYNYLPSGFFSTAEVYNPVTGTWARTAAMTTNRTSPTATLLPDGKVLVAGGWLMAQVQTNPPAYSSFSLTSGELYDLGTGNWTATTNTMTTGRNDHTASLLPNGQVLLAAGFQNGPGDRSSTELFDPIANAWIPITNGLNFARSHHTATILPNGRILVVGGIGSDGVTGSTEVYDSAINPPTGKWTNSGAMSIARSIHTATLLPNGKVLIAGGHDEGDNVASSAELYDPVIGAWTNTGALNIARQWHKATLLPNGKVLAMGGMNEDSGELSSAELFNPVTESWTETGAMSTKREDFTATLLSNGKVLVAGGVGDSFLSSTELYDPTAGNWTATAAMATVRQNHTATLLSDGKVLVAGGWNGSALLSSTELYDPATAKWKVTGSLNTARSSHTATLLPNGKVLVAGGNGSAGSDGITNSAELYDPATEEWIMTGKLNIARVQHTAALLFNGKVLIAGGWINTHPYTISSAELYDPTTGTWEMTGNLISGRNEHTMTLLCNDKVLVVGGISTNDVTSNVELYDVGLGFSNSWRPQITSTTSPLNLGGSLVVTGSQFRGISDASSGNSQNSSTGYPVVQLRSLANEQTVFLLTTNWSTNSFASAPVWNFPPGYALATVFVNGIPSTSAVVNVSVPIPTPPILTNAKKHGDGSFQFGFTNSVGALFGVLTATNIALPLSNWAAMGGVAEISPGQFQFTDPQAANSGQKFYRVYSP